jgi:hypothetical protein
MLAVACTAQAYTYDDRAGTLASPANWTATNTWTSSDGGTNYPQTGDSAIIDSHVVSVNLANPDGTIDVLPGGTLEIIDVGYVTNAFAELHLNDGVFYLRNGGANAPSWRGNAVYHPAIYIDADSVLSNSSVSGHAYLGGGNGAPATAAATVIGTNMVTASLATRRPSTCVSGLRNPPDAPPSPAPLRQDSSSPLPDRISPLPDRISSLPARTLLLPGLS